MFKSKVKRYLFGKEVINYGICYLLKQAAGVPTWFPFPIEVQHGWYPADEPRQSDLRSSSPIMLVYSIRHKLNWEKNSSKPCFVVTHPFVTHRKKNGYKRLDDARGTLVLPAHSGTTVTAVFNVAGYCEELKNLPSHFHPLTICLHYDDIRRGFRESYENSGFHVTTIGHRHDRDFADKFYSLLCKHKYATSNSLGTATLYSIEAGIPFFVLGSDPFYIDDSVDKIIRSSWPSSDNLKPLFCYSDLDNLQITSEQRKLVEDELGLSDGIDSRKLRYLMFRHGPTTALLNFFKAITIRPLILALKKARRLFA